MTRTREFTHQEEQKFVHLLFFIFGVGIMAWVPRFPELKANLGLSNAAFGTILTTGSIGAFLGLLTVGHVVQKWGVFKVGVPATVMMYTALAIAVNVSSPALFVICNIAIAFGVTAQHVSFNTHGFSLQERSGAPIVTTTAGYWSSGALITAILSGFLIEFVDFKVHMTTLAIFCGLSSVLILFQLRPVLVRANRKAVEDFRIRDIFTKFHLDKPVSLALACAVYLEFAVGDWGTIFTKERFDINSGLAAAPYIVFTIFMIAGRLWGINKIDESRMAQTARALTLVAGLGFGISLAIAVNLPAEAKWISFALVTLGFALAGAGSSILGPTITRAANRRSPHAPAVVVGQLGVTNNIITTTMKFTVAAIVGASGSISLALMLPAVLILVSGLFMRVLATQ
jgi:MFS family permease